MLTSEDVARHFNYLMTIDRSAVEAVFNFRVAVNDPLTHHIETEHMTGNNMLGALLLINSALLSVGERPVVAVYENGRLIYFKVGI